jgi:hypothetical protein
MEVGRSGLVLLQPTSVPGNRTVASPVLRSTRSEHRHGIFADLGFASCWAMFCRVTRIEACASEKDGRSGYSCNLDIFACVPM